MENSSPVQIAKYIGYFLLVCIVLTSIALYTGILGDVGNNTYSHATRGIRTDTEINETVNSGNNILVNDSWFNSTFAQIQTDKATYAQAVSKIATFNTLHPMKSLDLTEKSEYTQLLQQRDSILAGINNKIGEYNGKASSLSAGVALPKGLPNHIDSFTP